MATSLTSPAPDTSALTPPRTAARRRARRIRTLWIYAFLMPTFVLYGLYTIYPIIASYWYSFVEWNGFTADTEWVGISNYERVLADPMFWDSVRITFVFMLLVAPLRVFGSFVLATVLNSPRMPWSGFFRTVYFLPVVTTTAIVGVVMQFILDPGSGPIALALRRLGLPTIDLLGDSDYALPTVALVYVWKFFGITMIYWLAALQTIPRDLFDAARVDGANALQVFRNITLPMLVPFLIIISLLTIEDCFRAFDLMQTMTAGGPLFSTEIIEIYIYRWAFAATIPQLGYASAAAVLFGLLVMIFIVLQAWGTYKARKIQQGTS